MGKHILLLPSICSSPWLEKELPSQVLAIPSLTPICEPLMPNSFRALITLLVQVEIFAYAFLPAAFCFLLTTLFLLFFMRSERECPLAVFSFRPLKTTTFANLPRAILLTAFFFMTFIPAFALLFFMLFMVFITDFFIGRAIFFQYWKLRFSVLDSEAKKIAVDFEPKYETSSFMLTKFSTSIQKSHEQE